MGIQKPTRALGKRLLERKLPYMMLVGFYPPVRLGELLPSKKYPPQYDASRFLSTRAVERAAKVLG